MAKEWKSQEFEAEENVVGHGRESIQRLICKFLNERKIPEGAFTVACYTEQEQFGPKRTFVRAVLFYMK